MSTKATLALHASEGEEPAWHLYKELGESGVVYLDLEDIGIGLLARERCSREAAGASMARVSEEGAEIWRKENGEAIACYNTYVEQNGLPLDELRTDA